MSTITPLWNRMGEVFKYGFEKSPIIVCALSAISIAVASVLPVFMFAFLLLIVGILYPYKYAYTALEQTAEGDLKPPELNGNDDLVGYEILFKQLGVLVVLIAFTFILGDFNSTLAWIFLYSGLLLLPASIMTMGMTHSFQSAMNPILLVTIIYRVGWYYLGLIGLIMMMYNMKNGIIGKVFGNNDLSFIVTFLVSILDAYFTIIIFHMMGYFLYQFHEELGENPHYHAKTVAEREGRSLTSGVSLLFDQFMEQGNTSAALEELKTVAAQDPHNVNLQKRLETMLVMSGDIEAVGKHNKKQFPELLKASLYEEAADAYLNLVKQGETVPEIKDDKVFLPLAEALRKQGKAKEIVSLVKVFHKNFPLSQEKPAYFLFAARALSEDLNRDDKALKLLNAVLKAYPKHDLIEEVKNYKALLKNFR